MAQEVTRELARFAAELTYDKIPPPVIKHLKLCLLDTFGCGLFGSTIPRVGIATKRRNSR